MAITEAMIDQLAWDKMDGLLPCVVQDAHTGSALMLGYMNKEALAATLQTGTVTFFSRSKQRLWCKGETSGHTLALTDISADCDNDALLALAIPAGPTCHLGNPSCWMHSYTPALTELAILEQTIAGRSQNPDPQSSYTARLLQQGRQRCAQKVGEEGVEVALATISGTDDELLNESADLLYHLLVALRSRGFGLHEVTQVLQSRRN